MTRQGRIYTWAGDVLISLNPYARIDNLYQVRQLTSAHPDPNPDLDQASTFFNPDPNPDPDP